MLCHLDHWQGTTASLCKIIWKDDRSAKEQSVDDIYVPIQGEQTTPDDLPELEDCSDDDVNQPMIAPCQDVPH
jgi:hypothetical protein